MRERELNTVLQTFSTNCRFLLERPNTCQAQIGPVEGKLRDKAYIPDNAPWSLPLYQGFQLQVDVFIDGKETKANLKYDSCKLLIRYLKFVFDA